MNYVKFYGLLGNQHGIQISLNPTKLKQLKNKKYIRVQEHLYEAASVFEKDGICYANMNYIKGRGSSQNTFCKYKQCFQREYIQSQG